MANEQPVSFSASPMTIPFLLLPGADTLFSRRASRLKRLADGHAMGDYLAFMAEVALAQQHAMDAMCETDLPEPDRGDIPLPANMLQRSRAWQSSLKKIAEDIAGVAPQAYADRLKQLTSASEQEMDRWGQCVIDNDYTGCDIGIMPLVAASLQVYWAAMAQRIDSRRIASHSPGYAHGLCPVCGALPVGSVVLTGTGSQGLRYLCCSRCSTQWNMERIRCVHCSDSRQVFYYAIENSDHAIQAETCDACHSYSKVMNLEKNPALDIMADDLATMPLDILVGDAGYQRYGANPFLITEEIEPI